MSTSYIEYKCRRCGEIDKTLGSAERNCRDAVIEATVKGYCDRYGHPVHLVSIHTCPDGGLGVTDLIGCK